MCNVCLAIPALLGRKTSKKMKLGVNPPPGYFAPTPTTWQGYGNLGYGTNSYGTTNAEVLRLGMMVGTITKMSDSIYIAERATGFGDGFYVEPSFSEAKRRLSTASCDELRELRVPSTVQVTYLYIPSQTGFVVNN